MTDVVGPASLALGQGVGAFSMFLPRLSDVRKTDPATDHSMVADVRVGEIAAVALTVGVGAVITALTKDNTPIIVSLVVAVGLVVIYETALRRERPMEQTATNHLTVVDGGNPA